MNPSQTTSPRPEVHGHRGCRGLRPENTIPGFLHALSLGVDVLELDVVISQDGQVVVAHEPWLTPELGTGPAGEVLTAGEGAAYNFFELPYSRIRGCEVGRRLCPGFPEQVPVATQRPLLREVFRQVESRCQQLGRPPVSYAVEVKSVPAAYSIYQPLPAPFLAGVLHEVQLANLASRVRLMSFDYEVLRLARAWHTSLPLCLLIEDATPCEVAFRYLGFVPDIVGPAFRTLSSEKVAHLRQAYPALSLVPWTVNKLADLNRILSLAPDGITTDYPDRLLNLLNKPLAM